MHVLRVELTILILQTMSAEDTDDPEWRAIYEKRCKELKDLLLTLIIHGSGHIRKNLRRQGLPQFLEAGLTLVSHRYFRAYALKHYFDEIHTIDILDCNGGDHGYPFATNFNPEINLREVSANGSYWTDGHWVETKPMEWQSAV